MGLAFFYTLFSYTEGCILNTTDNYQLNQWEGTDRILRTDFNKDNLKTDDAVAELRAELAACPMVKFLDITVQEDTSQVDVDVSDLNLQQYYEIFLYIYLSPSTTAKYIALQVNGLTDGYFDSSDTYVALSLTSVSSPETAPLVKFSLFVGPYLGTGTQTPVPVEEIHTLNIRAGLYPVEGTDYLAAGTRVILYGLRR